MSHSLAEKRDRLRRQVEELEQNLAVRQEELELLSSDTDGGSDCEEVEDESSGILAQRNKIQREIENLENLLGSHSPITVSDDDSSSDESELGLSLSVDSCLQMNLVYQQVVQETLDQLEVLLTHNHRQQKELTLELSGPIKVSQKERATSSSYEQPINMFLGRFLKPYFKDKLTGLGPPANEEFKEKSSRMAGTLDNNRLKIKRWESWQKNLLIHSVSRDHLKRLIQPKLSRVEYLNQKLSSAEQTDGPQLREQINSLEEEIKLIRAKTPEELIGHRYEEHDWQKISNIDFEGTRDAEDLRCFWQNFLHPSVNKSRWSQEEVHQLKDVSRRHQETHWKTIAEELGTGRTGFMCLQVFQQFISDSLKRSAWTPAEDRLLTELVNSMRIGNFIPYTQISYFMQGRNPTQLIYRWNQVLDPRLKKGAWTADEDQLLLQAVSRHGEKDWWKIRLEVPGRTDSSCRDRYLECLKGGKKIGSFDQQEKDLLLELVEKHGVGRWSRISAEIPHRSDAQCLRAWKTLTGRQQRRQRRRRRCAAKDSVRRTVQRVKETQYRIEEEEEEEEVVKYMDTDDELEQEVVEKQPKEVKEEEEKQEGEEQHYVLPPMKDWVPAQWEESGNVLRFRPAVLPATSVSFKGTPARCTILGKHGPVEVLGPPPCLLPQWKRKPDSMMMVSPEAVRAYLRGNTSRFRRLRGLLPSLQAAVLPWIGRLLICRTSHTTVSDHLRGRAERRPLPSCPVFLLLLQVSCVDVRGCKDMIQQRKRILPPSDPVPSQRSRTSMGHLQLQDKRMQPIADLQHLPVQEAPPPPSSSLLPPTILVPQPPPLRPPAGTTLFLLPALPAVPRTPTQAPCDFKRICKTAAPSTRPSGTQVEAQRGGVTSTTQPEQELISVLPSSLLTNQQAGFSYSALLTPPSTGNDRKKKREEEVCGGGGGEVPEGKRIRKMSNKAQILQEGRAEAQKRNILKIRKTRPRQSGSGTGSGSGSGTPPPGVQIGLGQPMWMMTAGGLVQMALVPSGPPPPAGGTVICQPAPTTLQFTFPVPRPNPSQPRLLPPGPQLRPTHSPLRANPAEPPPLRMDELQFDPTLMFLESRVRVREWLSGHGGAVVPGSGVALPYLPPFISTLRSLSALLLYRESLIKSALHILDHQDSQNKPRNSQTTPTNYRNMPRKHQNTPTNDPTTPTNHQTTPTSNQNTPTNDPTTPTNHQTTPTSNQNTPTNDPTTLTNHQTTPTNHQATSRSHLTKPRGSQTKPRKSQTKPRSSQTKSKRSQTKDERSQTTPLNLFKELRPTAPVAPAVDDGARPTHVDLPDSSCDQSVPVLSDTLQQGEEEEDQEERRKQQQQEEEERRKQQQEEEEEEARLLLEVRQVVSKRFSTNPAYQLLKARFLSYFTVPAFLATVQPDTAAADQEGEAEQEEGQHELGGGAKVEGGSAPAGQASAFAGIVPPNQQEPGGTDQDQQEPLGTVLEKRLTATNQEAASRNGQEPAGRS